ncbi:AAA family ATPase [Candidatus Dependentiae bacterium]|nr:AAA family ATPase [Candidatus Dependentiae bacterium]
MKFFNKTFLIFLFLVYSIDCSAKLNKSLTRFLGGGFIGVFSDFIFSKKKKSNKSENFNNFNDDIFSNKKNFNILPENNKKNDVTFKDIIGIDEVKEEVKIVVDFLQNPKKYKCLGAKIPKGILLQGPPGNGKTLLARAVANETNCSFFYESGSSFVELYVGVGAKRIRELFDKAGKNKPAIIFLDEIDAIGGANRGIGSNEEYRQTLNEFLCQLDGFKKDDQIILIAATNNAYALDKALMRPGRFTKIIKVPMPDEAARREILEFYTKKLPSVKVRYSVIEDISKQTINFSAADLENLVNEAALHAVKQNSDKVTEENFYFALEKTLNRNK